MGGRRNLGFTLLEVMAVVAILAIVVAIALPGYDYQVRKGHRASAQTFLTEVANRQSQYLLDARNYAVGASALTNLNVTVPASVSPYYDIAVETSTGGATAVLPPTFRIRATPKAGTTQVPDGELVLMHDGTKTRAGSAGW